MREFEGPDIEKKKQYGPTIELTTAEELAELSHVHLGSYVGPKALERMGSGIKASAKIAAMKRSRNDTERYFGIRDENKKLVATAVLQIRAEGDKKWGYLNSHSTNEPDRGQGLARQLTQKSIAVAREAGCTYVEADVVADNPRGLVTKLNDHFVITRVENRDNNPIHSRFQIMKPTEGNTAYDSIRRGAPGETNKLEEVPLSNLSRIENLINNEQWVGIDIKNIGNAKDNDPTKWVLILEKIRL